MSEFKELFDSERRRVYEPGPFFTQRVMARLPKQVAGAGIWDAIPGSSRPVLALALMLILCFMAVEVFVPQMPQRGMVESFLAIEQSPAESFLYTDIDVPSRQDVLEQLIALEEQ
jgi:hypothetical protein